MAEKDTLEELIEQLRQLKDPRVAGRTDHNLLDILVLALCAVMSGAQGWDDKRTGDARAKAGCVAI
ncbi:transposase family protein [Verminephrobacter eiseniae]|nr:transposase family protein [Verminephrobacter eiseniae]MCW5304598.1 transposase family protein [Verminephrobacter eiseniae]MCW8181667.1 transposase family protein [Verminephrobacter eiseniae]